MGKKKFKSYVAALLTILGLLIIVSGVGGNEQETISFYQFLASIWIGLTLMVAGLFIGRKTDWRY